MYSILSPDDNEVQFGYRSIFFGLFQNIQNLTVAVA